jgi:hypothetical protein
VADAAGDRGRFSRRVLMGQSLVVGAAASLIESDAALAPAAAAVTAPTNLRAAAVKLVINPAAPTPVTGTVGGRRSRAAGTFFGSTIVGSLHGTTFTAKLAQKDQVQHGTGYVTTTHLTGTMGGRATSLQGVFNLDSQFAFENGLITGTHAGQTVSVQATPNASFHSTGSAANVKGTFGVTPFSLVANLPLGQRGTVTGTVGGQKIRLTLTPKRTAPGKTPTTRLAGTYSGPVDLLALLVGTVAYFGG